jgi:hypothetical protein
MSDSKLLRDKLLTHLAGAVEQSRRHDFLDLALV